MERYHPLFKFASSLIILLAFSPLTAMMSDEDGGVDSKDSSTPRTLRRQEIQEEIADAQSGLQEAHCLVRKYENERTQCLTLPPESEQRQRGIKMSEDMMRTFNIEAGVLGNKLISLRRELKKLDE